MSQIESVDRTGDLLEHLSEVVKILEAALRHDPRKAIDYANLLASKLDSEHQGRQARTLRTVLAKSPAPAFAASGAGVAPPKDKESQTQTVDVLQPLEPVEDLVLHPYVAAKIEDFLASVRLHERWQAAGVATPNRLLLYGPPGTGKTSIAGQIAFELGLPLVTTRSDTLVSSLLGQTSRNIREVFEYAQSQPCVLFLDEFDALAKNRADVREIGELQRVVIALLQNIDALPLSTILVAATNHENLLDSAIWRRFEHTVMLALPDNEDRLAIWKRKLRPLVFSDRELNLLARYSTGLSGAAIQTAAFDIVRKALMDNVTSLPIGMAMRRLARILWSDRYDRFNSDKSEIAALREWAPDVYSIRTLGEIFEISTRQVMNALKGKEADGAARTDSAASGDAQRS